MKCIHCHAEFEPTPEEEAMGEGVAFCSWECCKNFHKDNPRAVIPLEPELWRGKYHVGDDVGKPPTVGKKSGIIVTVVKKDVLTGRMKTRHGVKIPLTPNVLTHAPRKRWGHCEHIRHMGFSEGCSCGGVMDLLPSQRGGMPSDPTYYDFGDNNN